MLLRPRFTGGATGDPHPIEGRARNLSVAAGSLDSAEASFGYDGINAGERRLAVHLDGRLADTVTADQERAGVAGLTTGLHTLTVAPLRWDESPGRLRFDPAGQRAILSWTPAEAADVAAYRIYWDAGAGTAPATLLDTVETVEIETREAVGPDTGTGAGRVTLWGYYTGTPPVNEVLVLSITAEGEYEWSYAGETGSGTFALGDTVQLPDGAQVTFLDEALAYQVDDSWNLRIGPATTYLTAELEAGSYQFEVRAVDATGNESEGTPVRGVAISGVPDAVTGVTLSWNEGTETLTVAWSDPGSCDEVRVYSNWNAHTGAFLDYVEEEGPTARVVGGMEQWTLENPPDGTLLFYLRPMLNGVLRPDVSLRRFSFPPTPADRGIVLGDPAQLAAVAQAGGRVLVTWLYGWRHGVAAPDGTELADGLASFDVWISATPVDFAAEPTVSVAAGTGEGYPVSSYSWLSDVLADGTYYVGVRAKTADGVTTTNTNTVTVTADGTAPEYDGALTAGPV